MVIGKFAHLIIFFHEENFSCITIHNFFIYELKFHYEQKKIEMEIKIYFIFNNIP